MADAMDLVQQRVEEERQRHIRAACARTPGVSRVLCIECEAPIPPARRRAIPGVQLCIPPLIISTMRYSSIPAVA
ncbi:TPA: TraR/DksA C4-type zinc finger protein [Escherichia coli]|nr:TraR/DksA C4-type zinc finger protein [Escherichia coli]